jgi:hypothetical protein
MIQRWVILIQESNPEQLLRIFQIPGCVLFVAPAKTNLKKYELG